MNQLPLSASKRGMRSTPRSRRRLLLVAAAMTVLTVAAPVFALGTGSRAPEIGADDTDGNRVTIRGLRGKVVLVDFWASWCDPCKQELPVLERIYAQYQAQGLVIIGVNIDRRASNMRTFLRRTDLSFPVVHDADQSIAGRYRPSRMPSSYLIDRRGIVRHVHEGFRASDASGIERRIRDLLAD